MGEKSDKPVKFGIQIPYLHNRRLRLWARLKNTPRASLASNILQSRIEANWEEIDKDLDAVANYLGVTREELEADWLNGGEEED